MWERFDDEKCYVDTYYMIISENGEIVQGAKSLNQHRLNTFEQPLFWNDSVCWVSCGDIHYNWQASSDNAIVYQLSLIEDNTTAAKGSQIVMGNVKYKVTEKICINYWGSG